MIGRSSRARGNCQGSLFAITTESPEQVMLKLRGTFATEMEELKNLLKVIWSKRNSKDLIETIA